MAEGRRSLRYYKKNWTLYHPIKGSFAAPHFVKVLSKVKKKIKERAFKKKERDEKELIQTEKETTLLQDAKGGRYLNIESKTQLEILENIRRNLLMEQEEVWRLKSMAIWLESRDDNTKFFQAFAKGRKY